MCRVKAERNEQFAKRMSREDRLTKHQREIAKEKNMRIRDAFDMANLGHFKRCFPHEDKVIFERVNWFPYVVFANKIRQASTTLDFALQ